MHVIQLYTKERFNFYGVLKKLSKNFYFTIKESDYTDDVIYVMSLYTDSSSINTITISSVSVTSAVFTPGMYTYSLNQSAMCL